MQSDHTGTNERADGALDAEVTSPREALRRELNSLEVPAGTRVMFSPYEREYRPYFARVEVTSFEDVQTLGLIPRGLSEEKVRRAVAADDEETYKLAQGRLSSSSPSSHGCDCEPSSRSKSPIVGLRQDYEGIRRKHNPALARLLSEHLGTRVEWDSAVAGISRSWARYTEVSRRAVIDIALVHDITIERGATLRLDASVKALYAGTIWIHSTGRLISERGYLKIWAHAVAPLANRVSITAKKDIPWLAHT